MSLLNLCALFIFSAATTALAVTDTAEPINCTEIKNKSDALSSALCSAVLDPLKAKRGEYYYVNCLGGLEDGYTVNLCQSVRIVEQIALRDLVIRELKDEKVKSSAGREILNLPVYFAGKDEVCSKFSQTKPVTSIKATPTYIYDITVHMPGGSSEQHCVVPGSQTGTEERLFTMSPKRCTALKKKIGKEVLLTVAGDHVCEVR